MKVKIITMLISIGIMGVFIPGVTTRICVSWTVFMQWCRKKERKN